MISIKMTANEKLRDILTFFFFFFSFLFVKDRHLLKLSGYCKSVRHFSPTSGLQAKERICSSIKCVYALMAS